jgi:hypothetical protein
MENEQLYLRIGCAGCVAGPWNAAERFSRVGRKKHDQPEVIDGKPSHQVSGSGH